MISSSELSQHKTGTSGNGKRNECDALLFFFISLCPEPTHALTITFKKTKRQLTLAQDRLRIEKTIVLFLSFLNAKCFGHGTRRKGYKVGSIVVLEGLREWDNLHAHIALTAPPRLTSDQFNEHLFSSIRKCHQIDRQIDLQACERDGWYRYIGKDGIEGLVPQCCSRAKP